MKQELSPAIEDYVRFRSSQDMSKETLRQERMVLKKFLTVVGNVYCHAIDSRHVERHFEAASKTRSPRSLQLDHGILSRFFEWARFTSRMPVDSNPMYGRRRPRGIRHERNRIPVQDFPRLLDVAGERDPRDRALVAMLLYTLMRDGEITDLRIRDLDLNNNWLKARIHKTHLEDLMPVCSELEEEMRTWLTHYTTIVGPLEPHYYLIPARAHSPIIGDGGRIVGHQSKYRPEKRIHASGRIVTPILEAFGFPVRNENGKSLNEGAHTIRRSGARALFDSLTAQGGYDHPLRVVQSMLHHSSMQMTEHYLGITSDRRSRDEIIRAKRMYAPTPSNVVTLAR